MYLQESFGLLKLKITKVDSLQKKQSACIFNTCTDTEGKDRKIEVTSVCASFENRCVINFAVISYFSLLFLFVFLVVVLQNSQAVEVCTK